MAFKFVIISCLVAMVRAGALPAAVVAEPVVASAPGPVLARIEEFDPVPQYTYAYNVQDTLTGDSKGQYESRDGAAVAGSYYIDQPDFKRRTVEYVADDVYGFRAQVRYEPLTAPAVVAEPAVVAAEPAVVPAARVVSAPVPAPVVPAARVVSAPAPAAVVPSAFFGQYAYSPFSRFTAPFAYPSAPAQVVAV